MGLLFHSYINTVWCNVHYLYIILHRLLKADNVGKRVSISEAVRNKVRRKDSTVYGSDRLKENADYIMTQYIFYESENCVNISSSTRKEIINTFHELWQDESKDVLEWVLLFDGAFKQILGLLKHLRKNLDFLMQLQSKKFIDTEIPRQHLYQQHL